VAQNEFKPIPGSVRIYFNSHAIICMLGNVYHEDSHRVGVISKFYGKESIYKYIKEKISTFSSLGFSVYIFELDENFLEFDITPDSHTEDLVTLLARTEYRISLYLKTKRYLTSIESQEVSGQKLEITKCEEILSYLKIPADRKNPIIVHVGGSHGNRKKTMEIFCEELASLREDIVKRVAVINDDKPSLFSVKDLLAGVFYTIGIPIVFRSNSYLTNQGGLSVDESLYLAASTWKGISNPLFVYLPTGEITLTEDQKTPFGMDLDIIYDNQILEKNARNK
jgi:hypothetical protein